MNEGPVHPDAPALPPPVIHAVIDATTGQQDRCTPGGRFMIQGRGFGEWEEPPLDIGVYIQCVGRGELHRVLCYDSWRGDEIRGRWPGELTGSLLLFVETRTGSGAIHSGIHPMPIRIGFVEETSSFRTPERTD